MYRQRSTAQPICPRAAVEVCELGSKHGLTLLGDDEKAAAAQGESFGTQTGTQPEGRRSGPMEGRVWARVQVLVQVHVYMQLMKISRNEFLNHQRIRLHKMNSTAAARREPPPPPPTSVTSPLNHRGGG